MASFWMEIGRWTRCSFNLESFDLVTWTLIERFLSSPPVFHVRFSHGFYPWDGFVDQSHLSWSVELFFCTRFNFFSCLEYQCESLVWIICNFNFLKSVSYLLKIAWFLLCRSMEVFDGKQWACVLRQKEVHVTATAAQSELRLRHSRADDAKAYNDQSAQVSVQISRRLRHLN